ncbi:anoctamin-5 [Anopheles nili]|uniref:anoctamin-5 n=1 Tax=Anopheles nili TaxID=185578 RepID=UPI00237B947A|nr:anoctamin-5 [Anopheles nili]
MEKIRIISENSTTANGGFLTINQLDTIITEKLPQQEDVLESSLLKAPEEKWPQTENGLSRKELSPSHTNEEQTRSPDLYSNLFGPKISGSENIPGTPMDTQDIASEFNKSFNSSTTSIINERRRSSSMLRSYSIENDQKYIGMTVETQNSLSDQIGTGTTQEGRHFRTANAEKNNFLAKGSLRNLLKLRKASDQSDTRRSSQQDKEGLDPESLMFRDGRRKIDMVLCYEEDNQGVMTELEALKRNQRKLFQENLVREGLEFEVEDKAQAFDGKTYFIKIHIPWRTESRYAEVMNLKLPVKRFITISVKEEETALRRQQNKILSYWNRLMSLTEYNHGRIENEPSFYSATANGNPEEQFIVKDRCTSYTSAQRSLIVMQILMRTRFDETEKVNNVGIRRLLNDGTYLACFPLHEGRYDTNHSSGAEFDRRLLYLEWARPIKWYKKQPLCLVRKYFGDKIALYFCWLGFYTKMLYAPAIVGLFCFLYGLASMDSSDNIPTKEICDQNGPGKTILCPLCDRACSYQQLHESCFFAQLTYLFDNPSTVFFAIFMSFWATTFLELWKRKQSVLVWEWDLQNIENEEDMRPEFETTVKTYRINPVTREKEPYMPTWTRAIRFMATSSAVLFMISIVLGAVLGTIIYRISLVSVIYSGGGSFFRTHAKLFTTMTAALINLIIIMLLTKIYHRLALYLTNLENPRTQTEYEDSYTVKIFVFEFMNFYSSLIYIAFFKGRFYDYPGDDVARKSEFLRLKGDICDPAGCLSELCIQLAIIMVGKQCWNNFMEYFFPAFYNWWRQRKHKQLTKDETHLHMAWEQDYHLQDPGKLALFDEYLEMIVQYGFVTLFVAAFPLAPLFALLNNIAEIRLDAYKMVTQSRRPLAERVEDIGAWYGILKIITYTAVVSNAFVIAYTSDFIPRMVYKYVYSPQFTLHGYIEHSLSTFNTSDYKEEWGTKTESDPDTCQYRGYRNGPEADEQYGLSPHYWHVFAARLAFVVIFEHIVFVLTGIMQFIIPDIPIEVKTQIQREQLLAKEAKYQHGLKKSRETDYEEILHTLREQSNNSRQGMRGSWARRLSRLSDGLDAHVEVPNRPRHSLESTVWEVT